MTVSNSDTSPRRDRGFTPHLAVSLLALMIGAGCDASPAAPDAGTPPEPATPDAVSCAPLEQTISATLDLAAEDPEIVGSPDFSLLLATRDGRTYAHSHGASTPTDLLESASTSKLVAAVVLLDLVDQGVLSLDTKAHDLLPFWTETTVTLRHLMSFTSGFSEEPPCVNVGFASMENCVESIFDLNSATAPAAGTEYDYASTHLQVAGLMAIKATNKTWAEIFAAWQTRTGLFPTGSFDLPSTTNPRLAGGMHWTATEYLAFLRALADEQLLTPTTREALFADQRGTATVAASPAWGRVQEDWSYGLGNWLECPTATTLNSFDCGAGHRNSSPGAYGSYPFIDFDHHYVGILSRMGTLGQGFEGVLLFRTALAPVTRWADGDCGP